MALTADQIAGLAPDPAAAAAGRKLAAANVWRGLGQNETALWGECQGSALYQVRVERAAFAAKCSCPSRKFPCKHALGLLFLSAERDLPAGEPPGWVTEWLSKRTAAAAKPRKVETAPDPDAQAKRAARRLDRVLGGLDVLDLWLADLARTGLASLEGRPSGFFEQVAARLVDAQAPGLASRVRRIRDRIGGEPSWSIAVLDDLGLLALAAHAFRRIDSLDEPLRVDLRQLVGFTLDKDEVIASGDRVDDSWAVVGQNVYDDERFRAQRTWLIGQRSGRRALILQFAAGAAPFAESFIPGSRLDATLAFWPGAVPQRAMVEERRVLHASFGDRIPGSETVAEFLDGFSNALACQPWLDRFYCALRGATPMLHGDRFVLRDHTGHALPLAGRDHWKLLAISGGRPVDVAGEWNGKSLLALGATSQGVFHSLRSET